MSDHPVANESTNGSVDGLLDELAVATVLGTPPAPGGGSPPFVHELDALISRAEAQGLAQVAAGARSLGERLAAMDPASPEFYPAVQAGIRELREIAAGVKGPESNAAAASPAPAALADDPELVADFIGECREHLQTIEHNVLAIEQDAGADDAIHAIFRAFHTIKGLAGFLEFEEVRETSHETETLLDRARNGALTLTPPVVDLILESADYINGEVRRIEACGNEPAAPTAGLLARLRNVKGEPETGTNPDLTALAQAVRQPEATAPEPSGAAPLPETPAEPSPAAETRAAAPGPGNTGIAGGSVKVETAKLDFLIDMVGEMLIAQSLVRHNPEVAAMQNAVLMRNIGQLSRITAEVQKTAMSMRMVPIGILFQKMGRLVRDLCRKSGKSAELVTSGEETELDRNIVEQLADPLMHMVRNAVDHGVEPPEARLAAGKSATARVELRASHQAGNIVVEIADDGRGMDRAAILRKAREKGLVEEGARLSDAEVYNLIFEPGFSTAERVTDISGRGVGMDVVKRHIQKLRGRTEVSTVPGKGTTFRLKLPLTLAIIDGLIAGVGKERYIVPIFAVKEMLRPTEGMVGTIEGRREIALVRGRVLPVVRLYRRFGVAPRSEDPLESLLIITESQGVEYCLIVDDLLGKQEVVIKSLGETLQNIAGVAGGAILGDGRVALILDMNGLFNPVRTGVSR
jgi:two-component system chemotaxis sensor kinase CheA